MTARRPSATTKMDAGAQVDGLKETLRAFGRLDKAAQKAARDEVQKVANVLSAEVASAGRSTGDRRDAFVAQTVRGTRERSPVIKIGAAKRFGRGNARASDLMFGMEFGSTGIGAGAADTPTARGGEPGWRFPDRTPQLRPRGNAGRWIFPTVKQQQPKAVQLWAAALEKVSKVWGKA